MKTLKFISLIILSFVFLGSCSSTKTNHDLIQGSWVSVDDENSSIEITADNWISKYSGEDDYENEYIISNQCANSIDDAQNPNGNYISMSDYGEIYCYEIIKLDDETLEISYLDRGNTLTYKRK